MCLFAQHILDETGPFSAAPRRAILNLRLADYGPREKSTEPVFSLVR